MNSCSIIGIASESGIPLFIRHTGPGKPPPFALIGSLNGVHVFGETQGVTLFKACTDGAVVLWKTYHNCVRLILVRGTDSDATETDSSLLDLVIGALVLGIGLTNLSTCKNIERLKKELKPCMHLVDEILERYAGNSDIISFSHITKCVEYILPPDQLNIQLELEKFTDSLESSHGCLLTSSGQILFATKSFWNLSGSELSLLSFIVSTKRLGYAVGKDVPVYLPDKSPTVPFRLLLMRLSSSLIVALLCGPTPALPEALKSAYTFWGSHGLTLEAIAAACVCSIPVSVHPSLDPSIQGIFLVNYETKRSLTCFHSQERGSSSSSSKVIKMRSLKSALISSVYRNLYGNVLTQWSSSTDSVTRGTNSPIQSYISTDEFKVFALQQVSYHLIILLPPLMPLHIARDIGWKTLEVLTKGKAVKI